MEEVKKPGRDLPVSVYLTFTVVIIKYILTNVAYFTLVPPQELLHSDAVALVSTFGGDLEWLERSIVTPRRPWFESTAGTASIPLDVYPQYIGRGFSFSG
jgi:amino acid transporter